MAYLASDKVTVFPCIGRGEAYYSSAKYLSESNLIRMVSAATNSDSYVISANGGTIDFVLHGYLFHVEGVTTKPCYASIKVEGGVISGADSEGDYKGLSIVSSAPTDSDAYSLQLLDSSGNVPSTSLLRINRNAVFNDGVIEINGGTV